MKEKNFIFEEKDIEKMFDSFLEKITSRRILYVNMYWGNEK